jgi:hypothetical protein
MLVAVAYADVYKYKDEKGNVLYTDKPMFLPAERISIKTETSNIVDLDESNSNAAQPEAGNKSSSESAADKKKNKQAESAGKAEMCAKARKDYLDRMSAQRLYEDAGNGQKRFLTEKELTAARTSAKQAMDALCN